MFTLHEINLTELGFYLGTEVLETQYTTGHSVGASLSSYLYVVAMDTVLGPVYLVIYML